MTFRDRRSVGPCLPCGVLLHGVPDVASHPEHRRRRPVCVRTRTGRQATPLRNTTPGLASSPVASEPCSHFNRRPPTIFSVPVIVPRIRLASSPHVVCPQPSQTSCDATQARYIPALRCLRSVGPGARRCLSWLPILRSVGALFALQQAASDVGSPYPSCSARRLGLAPHVVCPQPAQTSYAATKNTTRIAHLPVASGPRARRYFSPQTQPAQACLRADTHRQASYAATKHNARIGVFSRSVGPCLPCGILLHGVPDVSARGCVLNSDILGVNDILLDSGMPVTCKKQW